MKRMKPILLKLFQLVAFLTFSAVVFAQPKANFSATPTAGCSPVVVDFRDMSTGNPTSWKWDLGNGSTNVLEQNPKGVYIDPGTYTVKLVVKNASGTDSIVREQYIVVYATPDVKFTASDSTGCFPLKVKFTDLSRPGSGTITGWQWDFGDGTLSTQQNPSHTYITGTYCQL